MYVFVYGTLKSNYPQNRYIRDNGGQLVGPAQLSQSAGLVLVDLGPFPALVPAAMINRPGMVVTGELYTSNKRMQQHLDGYEGYPRMYDRAEKTVSVSGAEYSAFVYFMREADYLDTFDFTVCEDGVWNRQPASIGR